MIALFHQLAETAGLLGARDSADLLVDAAAQPLQLGTALLDHGARQPATLVAMAFEDFPKLLALLSIQVELRRHHLDAARFHHARLVLAQQRGQTVIGDREACGATGARPASRREQAR